MLRYNGRGRETPSGEEEYTLRQMGGDDDEKIKEKS